jgi:hypothetical protein
MAEDDKDDKSLFGLMSEAQEEWRKQPPTDTALPDKPFDPKAFDEQYRQLVPSRQYRPANTFAHFTDADELALSLLSFLDMLDLSCPEIKALVDSTKGSFHGEILAERLAPKTHVGKHKAMRLKRPPKGKRAQPPSLFALLPND